MIINRLAQPASGNAALLSPKNYAFLQQYIHSESGIVIDGDKQYLLESRLLPILREHRIDSLDALSGILASRSSAPLSKLVIEAMTTNETLFFRDTAMFDALKVGVFPSLFERTRGVRRLRIWSAASSSGQEAYSLAMMLTEMGKGRNEVEILGTDLSNQVLDRARQGKYAQFEVNRGLPGVYLTRYFTRSGLEWQLKEEVRSMVRFEQMDLRRDFSLLGSFDLILCRNVLIYFDAATKTKIIDRVKGLLHPGAVFVLGCAETIINVHSGFQRSVIGQSTFYSV